MKAAPVAAERIERAILVLRGQKVILDADLAALYESGSQSLTHRTTGSVKFPIHSSRRVT